MSRRVTASSLLVQTVHSKLALSAIPSITRRTTIIVTGGFDPRPGIHPVWSELHPLLEAHVDLDALACREFWMRRNTGAFLIDLREFIGGKRDFDDSRRDPWERMSTDYPEMTEFLLQSLMRDVLVMPFLAVLCKSGLHRSFTLMKELARRWSDDGHAVIVLHLSHIVRCDMEANERSAIYGKIISLVTGAVGKFSHDPIPRLVWSAPCSESCSRCVHRSCGKVTSHRVHICGRCSPCGEDCANCAQHCNRRGIHSRHRCYECYLAGW